MKNSKLNRLVKISLLGVIGTVLMFFEFALPIFPSFIKIDISDMPALIGTFALGPWAGIMIELLKNILHGIFASQTAFVGELANFIIGSVFVTTAGVIYKFKKSKLNAVVGLIVGTIAMTISACVLNYFVLLPLYEKAFNFPISQMVDIASRINGNITGIGTLILWSIAPFNILKGILLTGLTLVVYKSVAPVLKGEHADGKQVA
ncbi:ECF transporter S component [Clostridium sp. cel8]|jgi:riboflavin transporter|uniref:ECF transporter S component n=1 Tax=Clostridium sp. cel8 TaxID=2663123 RepID=UPI0015F5CF27|nr:ECF transporter S component [Clostridium sp. cel8]MBA5851385.1 ECF transporter S component [Clostridium sp. cel8]